MCLIKHLLSSIQFILLTHLNSAYCGKPFLRAKIFLLFVFTLHIQIFALPLILNNKISDL